MVLDANLKKGRYQRDGSFGMFVEGEWREIFCVNGVGDFVVPWFFCIFVIIKLSQA